MEEPGPPEGREVGTALERVVVVNGRGIDESPGMILTETHTEEADKPGSEMGAVGLGGMMLTETSAEPDGRAESETEVGSISEAGDCAPGVEVSEQIVVVTLTTVVDV